MIVTSIDSSSDSRVVASRDLFSLTADAKPPRGAGDGFRPGELLEAALACCAAITMRVAAKERGILLKDLSVKVDLTRADSSKTLFGLQIEFDEGVNDKDRQALLAIASQCAVADILKGAISIETR